MLSRIPHQLLDRYRPLSTGESSYLTTRWRLCPFDAEVMTDVLHHIDDANVRVLLRIIRSCLSDHATLMVLDVDRSPFHKFYTTRLVDRILNLSRSLHYRSRDLLIRLVGQTGIQVHHALPADRSLPLSDVIYLCEKAKKTPAAGLRWASIEGGEVMVAGKTGKGRGP
jgi:hypothetical protein